MFDRFFYNQGYTIVPNPNPPAPWNPAPASSGTTRTISLWFKRGFVGEEMQLINWITPFLRTSNYAEELRVGFNAASNLTVSRYFDDGSSAPSLANHFQSVGTFRDNTAWFHLVVAINTTLGASTDRIKIWINGERLTDALFNPIAQNLSPFNRGGIGSSLVTFTFTGIGCGTYAAAVIATPPPNSNPTLPTLQRFDGYVTEIYQLDGFDRGPSFFGEFKNNIWTPKPYRGTKASAYGNLGFYIANFELSTNYPGSGVAWWQDYSDRTTASNTNDLIGGTPNAGNFTDRVLDVPTQWGSQISFNANSSNQVARGNYCTFQITNAAISTASRHDSYLGGLRIKSAAAAADWFTYPGTIPLRSGKWYWEYNFKDIVTDADKREAGIYTFFGVVAANAITSRFSGGYSGQYPDTWGARLRNSVTAGAGLAEKRNNAVAVTFPGFTDIRPDIGWYFRCALDMDTGKIWFGYGNRSLPETPGFNPVWFEGDPATGVNPSYSTLLDANSPMLPAVSLYANYGYAIDGSFGQDYLSDTTNVPAGYKTICTTFLPEPYVKQSKNKFDIKRRLGTGYAQTIANISPNNFFTFALPSYGWNHSPVGLETTSDYNTCLTLIRVIPIGNFTPQLESALDNGPRITRINLSTNTVTSTIILKQASTGNLRVTPRSMVLLKSGPYQDQIAYIVDSGDGGSSSGRLIRYTLSSDALAVPVAGLNNPDEISCSYNSRYLYVGLNVGIFREYDTNNDINAANWTFIDYTLPDSIVDIKTSPYDDSKFITFNNKSKFTAVGTTSLGLYLIDWETVFVYTYNIGPSVDNLYWGPDKNLWGTYNGGVFKLDPLNPSSILIWSISFLTSTSPGSVVLSEDFNKLYWTIRTSPDIFVLDLRTDTWGRTDLFKNVGSDANNNYELVNITKMISIPESTQQSIPFYDAPQKINNILYTLDGGNVSQFPIGPWFPATLVKQQPVAETNLNFSPQLIWTKSTVTPPTYRSIDPGISHHFAYLYPKNNSSTGDAITVGSTSNTALLSAIWLNGTVFSSSKTPTRSYTGVSFSGLTNTGDCAQIGQPSNAAFGTQTITIPSTMTPPVCVVMIGTADDLLLIDGIVVNAGQTPVPGFPLCFQNSGNYTFVTQATSFTIAAGNTVPSGPSSGVGYSYNINFIQLNPDPWKGYYAARSNISPGSRTNYSGSGLLYLDMCWANDPNILSITEYSGNSVTPRAIPHTLGSYPAFVMVKHRTGQTDGAANSQWACRFRPMLTNEYFVMDNVAGTAGSPAGSVFQSGSFSTTNVVIGNNALVNTTGRDYTLYAFAELEGFSKVGTYIGNGSTNGPLLYTGFRPGFIIIKRDGGQDWIMLSFADQTNPLTRYLKPNTSDIYFTSAAGIIEVFANGFKVITTLGEINGNGQTHYYIAFAFDPFKYGLGTTPANYQSGFSTS
jgi:hypothetical protein